MQKMMIDDNIGALSYEKSKREIRLANKKVKEVFQEEDEEENESFYKPQKKKRY